MISASESVSIRKALDRYRRFEECLLNEVRLTRFGTQLDLHFTYIWLRDDSADFRLAVDPAAVVVRLMLLEWATIRTELPQGLWEHPERADWGLTEVAEVRIEDAPTSEVPSSRPRHKFLVEWESERRIEAIFGRLVIEPQASVRQIE